MAKIYAEINGELVEPKLLLDPPVGGFVNEPGLAELRELLRGFTPEQWAEGDASIHYPDGNMGIFFKLDYGYMLVLFSKGGREDYLLSRPTSEGEQYVKLEAGNEYTVLENYFVPFEELWKAVDHYLTHKTLDPDLLWTEEPPFPDLEE